jgi:hypothetical protein
MCRGHRISNALLQTRGSIMMTVISERGMLGLTVAVKNPFIFVF